MLDEERVERDPVPSVEDRAEPFLGLGRGPGAQDAEPVRDAVDVGVDRDRGDRVAEDEHAVRRLRADAGKRYEGVVGARDLAPEPLEDRPSALADHAALRPVESGRADQRLHLVRRGTGERARVGEPGEQPGRRNVGVRVPGALREDRADQDLEGVLRVVAQVGGAPVAAPVERREAVEDLLPEFRGRGGAAHARDLRAGRSGGGLGASDRPARPGSERSGSPSSASPRTSSPTR